MGRKGENIYKRKDGRWEGRYHLSAESGAKTRYRSVYGKSYREVREKLALKRREFPSSADSKSLLPVYMTIKEAAALWMEENRGKWKESTYATYRTIVEKHIITCWGALSAVDFIKEQKLPFQKDGGMEKKLNPLSRSYRHQIQVVIGQIFRFLDKKYHCGIPESSLAVTPAPHKVITTPEGETLRKLNTFLLNEAEKKDPTSIGILLSACCGLRIGELCALQWKHIDLEQGILRIRETMQRIRTFQQGKTATKIIVTCPKSKTSNREIPLPGYLLDYLKNMKGSKEGYVLRGRKKEYLEPRTMQYRFEKILRQMDIPHFNFHMLRHIFATNCISEGFDMKTLSELLGHSNITTTMRIYVHSDMERKKQLMAGYRLVS